MQASHGILRIGCQYDIRKNIGIRTANESNRSWIYNKNYGSWNNVLSNCELMIFISM